MQCLTCNADIPPQWVSAIQRNECPGCGGMIMDDASKELLNELREAMSKMPNDPEGLAGWLLSNYVLRKVGAAEPVNFHRKPTATEAAQEKKLKVAKNPVQDFLKRKDSGVAKTIEARKDFAEIVNQINKGEIEDPLYGNGEDLESEMDAESEYEGEADPYEEAETNRQQFKSTAKQLVRHSLVMPGNERPLTAEETAIMMQEVAGKASGVDQGENVPEALQQARLERLKKSRDVATGGTMGSFRRH